MKAELIKLIKEDVEYTDVTARCETCIGVISNTQGYFCKLIYINPIPINKDGKCPMYACACD
jgi:hypothetical protein